MPFFFTVLLVLYYSCSAQAFDLEDKELIILDEGQISYYQDPDGVSSFSEIRKFYQQDKFNVVKGNLRIGYVPDTVWIHFTFNHQQLKTVQRWIEIFPFYLDNIELFHLHSNTIIDHRYGGDFTPQSQKEEDYRGTVFKFDFVPGQHEFFIKLKTSSSMAAIIKIWEPEAFSKYLRNNYFSFGIYYSLAIVVLIFNLINYLISRRTIFIAYVLYLTFNSLQWLSISGFTSEFIFPETPLLANLTLGLSLTIASTMAFIFFILLFELKKYHPFIYRFNQFGAAYSLLTAVATPFGYFQMLVPYLLLIAIVAFITSPWIIFRLWHTNKIWNRLLAIAHASYAFLLLLNILSSLAVIPFTESFVNAGMLSNIFHVFMLHFAIMLHYRQVEKSHAVILEDKRVAEQRVLVEKVYREEQEHMLSMITHEMRTPIAMINASNESLKIIDDLKKSKDNDRNQRYEQIQNAVKRMNMVMDMALNRKEKLDQNFDPEEVDIVKLTEDVLLISGKESDIERIDISMQKKEIFISLDIKFMHIILINLIDNALKYSTPHSAINIDISLNNNSEFQGILWEISNIGLGIPEGMEEQIFEKFFRGDERSNKAGLGVGLFLVKKMVEKHSGKITANNTESGAKFSLYLPLKN